MKDLKPTLLEYLESARKAVLWKTEGLSEYDLRRPLTPTATNLLGLVKHLACMEAAYFGGVFARPFPQPLPWLDDQAEPNADMWAEAGETREEILDFYRRAVAHANATIGELDSDSPGQVPWWREGSCTLARIMVHMIAETCRHAGQMDIVRELVDGSVGMVPGRENLPDEGRQWWAEYRARVQAAADSHR